MLVKDRRGIIKSLQSALDTVFDTSEMEARQGELQQEIVVVADLLERCIAENSRKAQDQDEYAKRYEALAERYDKTKNELDEVTDAIADLHTRKADAQLFIRDLRKQENLVTEFTPELFCSLADTITVHDRSRIDVAFKDGTTISVGLEKS